VLAEGGGCGRCQRRFGAPDAGLMARATLCAMKKLLLLIALVALATIATKKVRSV
jgi:hypothetical protein